MTSEPATAAAPAWLESATDEETLAEVDARGGSLSTAGRRAAVAATLPVLGVYFASGRQPLEIQPAIQRTPDEPTGGMAELLAGIRLRVALAAATRLHGIVNRIVSRPTFRYRLVSMESAGAVTGQLDLSQLVLRAGQAGDGATYPVLTAQRAEQTPENVLAVYAVLWLLEELRSAMSGSEAPPSGPEHLLHHRSVRDLASLLNLPGLAACVAPARGLSRGREERRLLQDVNRRLRRREVANPTPYHELVRWLEGCLRGDPQALSGGVDWAFYGDRFDTKLFELWCLCMVATEVSRQLAVEPPQLNPDWRRGGPAYTWNRPAGRLSLYFQRSVGTLSEPHRARWVRNTPPGRPLGGVPDMVAHAVRREDGRERFALLDSKLRQRGGPPAEELYKIIGYVDNYRIRQSPAGAVLYHTTSTTERPPYEYQADGGGRLLALALNPASPPLSQPAIAHVASMLLWLLDIPPLDSYVTQPADEADEHDPAVAAEGRVRARFQELQALSLTLPASVLEVSRRRVRAMVGDQRWSLISADTKTMIATAEHVGFSLEPSADFSGPVIGVCASVEALLHTNIIEPVVQDDRVLGRGCRTLGQVIEVIRRATRGDDDRLSRAVRTRIAAIGSDPASVALLVPPLSAMNKRYRIPAAHRSLVSEVAWHAAWNAIVGPGRLLVATIDAMQPSRQ